MYYKLTSRINHCVNGSDETITKLLSIELGFLCEDLPVIIIDTTKNDRGYPLGETDAIKLK